MKSLRKVHGSGLGYSLLLVALSVGKVAVAQPDADSKATPAPGSTETSTPAAQTSDSEATAPAKADEKKPEPSKPEAAKTEPMPLPPTDATPAVEPSVPLTVEILPASGYFPDRNRGLVGGSLWLTMHGLQFPYMAPPTSKSAVRIAISGSVWDDTSVARFTSGHPASGKALSRWTNQGRAVLRTTPSYSTKEGWFVQGQVELVANSNQILDTNTNNMGGVDDLFVRAGLWNVFDITAGRYQGWEVYHYGMGLDLNTFERQGASNPNLATKPPQIYGLDTYWDRPNGGAGNYAAHVYFTDYLRVEVLGQIGTNISGNNTRGVRPIAILDLGYLKVKGGWEYGISHPQSDGALGRTRNNGFGGSVQFVLDPYIEGGINGAIGYLDSWSASTGAPNLAGSTTTKSYGAFLNGRVYGPVIVGLGANQTHYENLLTNQNPISPQLNGQSDWESHLQTFAAVQYSFWDKMFVKFVGSYARFHYEDILQVPAHPFTNKEYGGRLRMMYLF